MHDRACELSRFDLPGTGLQGWAADTLGEAAAYALVEVWAALGEEGAA